MSLLRPGPKPPFLRLGISFFVFGLINNVLYVIILSAALDLVPPSTPKGIIAFCNIAPALVAKVGWPYLLKGRIRYTRRLIGCSSLAVIGMIVVAAFESLGMRLLGICLASFASGLGELTFLQLSTTYHPPSVCGHAVGYFASGTGAAGLVGAAMWWELRRLGVRLGVGISAVLPFVTPVLYFWFLPKRDAFRGLPDERPSDTRVTTAEYTALPTSEEDPISPVSPKAGRTVLSIEDKWRIVRPLLVMYMLPLFTVYTAEYIINQGVSPTLVYPVPDEGSLLHHVISSVRDYYPLWQLIYQTFVFFSRSAISLGIPPLPERALPLPAIAQTLLLALLSTESGVGLFGAGNAAIIVVGALIASEGIFGGLAYVNVFYRVGQRHAHDPRAEREFAIGSIGFADSFGILVAALLAVPTEVQLCAAQVRRGKTICSTL